jgi:hypothetical protein
MCRDAQIFICDDHHQPVQRVAFACKAQLIADNALLAFLPSGPLAFEIVRRRRHNVVFA